MGMAEMADALVLLIDDVGRDDVFAQLYSAATPLEQEERECTTGPIINRFRGDETILDSDIRVIEDLYHTPMIDVVLYMQVDTKDEDSLSGRLGVTSSTGPIDIAVIRLPHIFNFTGFQILSAMNHVTLRYVFDVRELGQSDMVTLPEARSAIEDLLWLR